MELFVGALILLVAVWAIWLWVSATTEGEVGASRRAPTDEEVRSAAERAGHDYVLEPFDGDSEQGYTLRRVEDWQRLRWQSAQTEDGLLPFGVAGESYRMEELQAPSFSPGARISLVPERDNPHDPDAVAVYNEAGTKQAGYVPADLAEEVGQLIKEDPDYKCVSMWENRAEEERKSLRVLMMYGDVSVGVV